MNVSISRASMIVLVTIIAAMGCSDSTGPEPSGSHVSVTGDLTESWDATAYHGISTWGSSSNELEYFSVILLPQSPGTNLLAGAVLYKFGAEAPEVGTYSFGEYALGDTIPAGEFGGGFSGRNASDFAGYVVTSGSVTFTEVADNRVRGEFEMSGYYAALAETDTSRVVDVVGSFSTTSAPGS